jgi:hypothetical protein
MGSSNSVIELQHIHISLSTKYVDDKNFIHNIITNLEDTGFIVTKTDASMTTNEICKNIKNANIVIYCSTQSYGSCSTQAIEYSYLSENEKRTYNVVIDPYENRLFMNHVQSMLDKKAMEISSVNDITNIINEIKNTQSYNSMVEA